MVTSLGIWEIDPELSALLLYLHCRHLLGELSREEVLLRGDGACVLTSDFNVWLSCVCVCCFSHKGRTVHIKSLEKRCFDKIIKKLIYWMVCTSRHTDQCWWRHCGSSSCDALSEAQPLERRLGAHIRGWAGRVSRAGCSLLWSFSPPVSQIPLLPTETLVAQYHLRTSWTFCLRKGSNFLSTLPRSTP